LILSSIAPTGNNQGGAAVPQDVVLALVDSPVGAETVHSAGQPEVISALLNLEAPEASGGGAGDQRELLPEPTSLLLVGLGLSAVMSRLRRVTAR
jgi:hypothetical protein